MDTDHETSISMSINIIQYNYGLTISEDEKCCVLLTEDRQLEQEMFVDSGSTL